VTGPCAGTPCTNVTIATQANSIQIAGLASTSNWGVQVFNSAWSKVYTCFGNTCSLPVLTAPSLIPGTYFVKVDNYSAAFIGVCKKEQYVTIAAQSIAASAAVNFIAQKQGKSSVLKWATNTTATNILDYFVVERSSDNATFSPIYLLAVDAASDEQFRQFDAIDAQPLDGYNYYRLRAIFENGEELLSATQSVAFTSEKGLVVYPNPTHGDFLVSMDQFAGHHTTIAIYNLLGQEVFHRDIPDTVGQPYQVANSHLEEGIYQVLVTSEHGVRALGRVVVEQE
jgi:hypothetical protein